LLDLQLVTREQLDLHVIWKEVLHDLAELLVDGLLPLWSLQIIAIPLQLLTVIGHGKGTRFFALLCG
jgi:hypothetical protein